MADAEIIVVGGGAAGAAAAFHLAAAGRDVLLLERDRSLRGRACGGGMAASVQQWFPFDLTPAVDRVIRRVRFTWCLGDPVLAELPGEAPFWIVDRRRFDGYLLERARERGAVIASGACVEALRRQSDLWHVSLRGGETRTAAAVVLANGSASLLPAALGLGPGRPRYATAMSVEVAWPDGHQPEAAPLRLSEETACFEFGLVRHGFSWVFPRRGGLSIGVGSFLDRDQERTDFDAVLARLLPALGLASDAGERRLAALRVWNGHHPLHGAGIVAVGDAASLCDPFLAEGLRPALMSGTLAARAIGRWRDGETDALARYSRRMRTDWGESMAWGRRIAQVFYRFPGVGYQLGIKRPTAPQRIAQILSGSMGYGDIAQRVIRRLLLRGS
jgi:geranylgeranyl reductase family protein